MLCLQVRLISEHYAMAHAVAQTSPELTFRKMKTLRDLAMDGHVCAGESRAASGHFLLDCWETTVTLGQHVGQLPANMCGAASLHFSAWSIPCAHHFGYLC